jgi:hypothetical protein
MLSGRLVQMVEDHAEQLTQSLTIDLKENARTPEYRKLPDSEIHDRVFKVYHDLGEWLGTEGEIQVEAYHTRLGKRRADEGIPLSQVLYALIRTKKHLIAYVRRAGVFDSAMDLYQFQEFRRLVDNFFDKAIYYTTRAYEHEQHETASRSTASAAAN